MTKMKTRKMTKSTFAIVIMGIAMVAMLAFGGTFAYFTATTTDGTASTTTGVIKLNANNAGSAQVAATVVSGESVLTNNQHVTVTNASNRESYIFVTFTVTLTKSGAAVGQNVKASADIAINTANNDIDTYEDYFASLTSEQLAAGDPYVLEYAVGNLWTALTGAQHDTATGSDPANWEAVTGVYYYAAPAIADEVAANGTLHKTTGDTPVTDYVTYDVCNGITFHGKSNSVEESGTVTEGTIMGADITVTITSKAIQASGFDNDPAAAYAALMGAKYRKTPVNP